MNTLFDLNDIPEKQPDSTPQPEYVITYTDKDNLQWFYYTTIADETWWVHKGERANPKTYKTLHGANRQCKELNKRRNKAARDNGIEARVIVWSE